MITRYENCLIGRDPQTCDIRAGCRYWNRVSRLCEYRAVKAQERPVRREEADERVQNS